MSAIFVRSMAPLFGACSILAVSCATAETSAQPTWRTEQTEIDPDTLERMSYAAISLPGDHGLLVATPEWLGFYRRPDSGQILDMRVRIDDNPTYERFVCGARYSTTRVSYCVTDRMGDADPKNVIAQMKAGKSMAVSYLDLGGRQRVKKATAVTLDGFAEALPDCEKVKCLNGHWSPGS